MTDNPTLQSEKLEPCYCRSKTDSLSVKSHMNHGDFACRERGRYVYCSNCWACGPTATNDGDAIKYWNRFRAPVAAPQEGAPDNPKLREHMARLGAGLELLKTQGARIDSPMSYPDHVEFEFEGSIYVIAPASRLPMITASEGALLVGAIPLDAFPPASSPVPPERLDDLNHDVVYLDPALTKPQWVECPFCGLGTRAQILKHEGVMTGWGECEHYYSASNDAATKPGLVFVNPPQPLPAATPTPVEQCPATCTDFPLYPCAVAHRCVLDAGHPFDPWRGNGIHEFETHQTTVRPRSPSVREAALKGRHSASEIQAALAHAKTLSAETETVFTDNQGTWYGARLDNHPTTVSFDLCSTCLQVGAHDDECPEGYHPLNVGLAAREIVQLAAQHNNRVIGGNLTYGIEQIEPAVIAIISRYFPDAVPVEEQK